MTKIYFWSVWRSQFILFLDGCLRCPFVLFFLSNWIQMFPLPANEAFPSLCCRCIVRSPKCEASFKRGGVANTLFRGASLLTRCLCRFHKRQEYSRCDLSEKGDWLSDAPDARPSSYPWLSRSSQVVSLSSAAARSGSPNWHESGCHSKEQVGGDYCSQTSCKVRMFDWLYESKRIKQEAIWGLGVSLSGPRGIIFPPPTSVRKPFLYLWQEWNSPLVIFSCAKESAKRNSSQVCRKMLA